MAPTVQRPPRNPSHIYRALCAVSCWQYPCSSLHSDPPAPVCLQCWPDLLICIGKPEDLLPTLLPENSVVVTQPQAAAPPPLFPPLTLYMGQKLIFVVLFPHYACTV